MSLLSAVCVLLFWRAHLSALIMEALKKALEQLVSVVNPLRVLADNPDHGTSSVRFIQRVEILTQCGDDALVPKHPYVKGQKLTTLLRIGLLFVNLFLGSLMKILLVRILAENVPDDHNSLLNHVVDLSLDQVQQSADAALR